MTAAGGARDPLLVVVAAPSGTGKTSVCREVVARDAGIVFSVSHTTRPPREGEVPGHDYHFVSNEDFMRMTREDAFLEWAVYNDHRYGTSWAAVEAPFASGLDVLLEIEVQGATQVRARRPGARFVFLLPPSTRVLRERLRRRGTDSDGAIEHRLEVARGELLAGHDFDYAVVNDDLEVCVETLLAILSAERAGEAEGLRARFAPGPALERLQSAGS